MLSLYLQICMEPCWVSLGSTIPKITTATQQPAQFQPECPCWLPIVSIAMVRSFICPNRQWWHLSKAGTQRYPILGTRNQTMISWHQNDSYCPQKRHHSFTQYKSDAPCTIREPPVLLASIETTITVTPFPALPPTLIWYYFCCFSTYSTQTVS